MVAKQPNLMVAKQAKARPYLMVAKQAKARPYLMVAKRKELVSREIAVRVNVVVAKRANCTPVEVRDSRQLGEPSLRLDVIH